MRKTVSTVLAVSTALGTATIAQAQSYPTTGPTTAPQTLPGTDPAQTAAGSTAPSANVGEVSPQPVTPAADTTGVQAGNPAIDDVVVTARREAENVQNVPVSVQVVTGDSLRKLSINDATEVSKLAPGLTLMGDSAGAGSNQRVVLRGVTWQPGSGTPATPIYYNEVPFDPASTLQTLFDIGQIEVLRGPQGTTRGAPSISGAITITTRRPDLEAFGGYIQGQYGEGDHKVGQGAINIPIVKGVLAIRAAADIEDSQANRVFSVNNRLDPLLKSRTYRVTALFQPTDTISIEGMYQRRRQLTRTYVQVDGTGSPGAAASGIRANFNGPAIAGHDYRSVQDQPSYNYTVTDLITLNASWQVLGQTISYNFGRQISGTRTSLQAADFNNFLPGFEAYQLTGNLSTPFFETHEIRVSGQQDENHPFDYDIGWFQKSSHGPIFFNSPVYGLPGTLGGAFGAPGTPPGTVTTPDSRYVLNTNTTVYLGQVFDSFYGNVRFHLDSKTELSGGLSILRDRDPLRLNISTAATRAIAAPLSALGGLPCPGIPGVFVTGLVNSNYPGYCDALIPAGIGNSNQTFNPKYTASLYNFQFSHKFTDDILVYATTGTSFRTGLPAINNTGLPANLLVPKPESATSYEVGTKTSFGRRLRINADVFQINYDNQLTAFANVPYFNTVSGTTALTSIAFYSNVNARVRGAELEVAAKPLRDLSLAVNLSYSKITSRGGLVPSATGPAITATNPINFAQSPKGETLNTQAPFQATVNGSYDRPINQTFDGYFRFNVNFQGKNPNYGNFQSASGAYRQTNAYALVDLFAGLAGHGGAWDLGVYAKNVFNQNQELNRAILLNNIYPIYSAAASGYDSVAYTAPREVGVTLRYAFGSR